MITCLLCATLANIGCDKPTGNPGKTFDGIKSGMTIEEVDSVVGVGQEVAHDKLPEYSREELSSKNLKE